MLVNGRPLWGKPRPNTLGLSDGYDLRCLAAFVSHRLLRGRPRLLLHVSLFCLAFVLFTALLPPRLSDVVFGATYTALWHWGPVPQQGHEGGGLRIVLFGEHDIATPEQDGLDGSTGPSWTEVLCRELRCSNHLSFVPAPNPPGLSFVSNSFYASLLEPIVNDSVASEGPGRNYTFLSEGYPPKWDVPDLRDQVDSFLSLARPRAPPAETVWIFSLGMWDIWSLAAFPRDDAQDNIAGLAMEVFNQVDRLYEASLNPDSVAYSGSVKTPAQFRIFIPQLFDPSLLPAWQMDRPGMPKPHTIAEQTRNAARLTERWNHAIRNEMETWVKMPQPGAADDQAGSNNGVTVIPPNTPSQRKRSDEPENLPLNETGTPVSMYPLRDAITYDLPAYLLDVIVDRQLREVGIVDSLGYGAMRSDLGFQDVSVPCVHDPARFGRTPAEPPDEWDHARQATDSTRVLCDEPDRFLFHTSFTLGRRAIHEIGRQAADTVRRNDSVRAFWEGIGETASPRPSGPGFWAKEEE